MLAVRREARRRARDAHIAALETDVGFKPSVDSQGLPRIVVVRNPEGSWFMCDRWQARGFGGYRDVESCFKRLCVLKARKRLRAMVYSDLAGPTEVTL